MRMRYVLDCSAVINFLLQDGKDWRWVEPLFQAAVAGKVELHAPAYMLVEFINVLTKKANDDNSVFSQDDARLCLQSLESWKITYHDFAPLELSDRLLGLTFARNDELTMAAKIECHKDRPRLLTVYDIVYFELAQRLDATLVTSDYGDMVRLCRMAGCKCMHPDDPGVF